MHHVQQILLILGWFDKCTTLFLAQAVQQLTLLRYFLDSVTLGIGVNKITGPYLVQSLHILGVLRGEPPLRDQANTILRDTMSCRTVSSFGMSSISHLSKRPTFRR
jgi:hypothetical protein